jgi:FMN phosphatase YigB (HAD superfamily)
MTARGYQQRPNANDYYRIQDRFEDVTTGDAKKFTRLFNESAAIGFLHPLRDSVAWVRKLNQEHGYRFVCITSQSLDRDAQNLRRQNLERYFGNVFDRIWCLDTGSDKHEALEHYRDTALWWVEDKPENADLGHDMGLRSILLEHGHNVDHECPYPRVHTWREIYDLVTAESA